MTNASTRPSADARAVPGRRPDRAERRALHAVAHAFEGLRSGSIHVTLPDGSGRTFGPARTVPIELSVRDWSFFRRVLTSAATGMGESYVAGEWSTNDLVGLLRLLVSDREEIGRRVTPSAVTAAITDHLLHLTRSNRIGRTKRNIAAHYDLSNELYATFLDPTMTYSCAWFEDGTETLEQAQLAKYRRIADKARLRPGMHVLEIGCGWGGFASVAVREYGARVTGLTLSQEQASYARARAEREGIADRFDVQLIDYREVVAPPGGFDRVVSIEMLEAVGHRYLGDYFGTIERVMAPEGIAVVQVITIPEQRYGGYRWRPDFINKHVFPGGHLPSLEAMNGAMRSASQLFVEDLENLSLHYAETLRRWRAAFVADVDHVQRLGFDDRFVRLWDYYLAYCEAGFAERYVNDLQLVLTRTRNPSLGQLPYRRGSGGATPSTVGSVRNAGEGSCVSSVTATRGVPWPTSNSNGSAPRPSHVSSRH